VGASWAGNEDVTSIEESVAQRTHEPVTESITGDDFAPSDLAELAREQGMNTDLRRAIFITIMSASDYLDADMRLRKLKLYKKQELEIPRVLIHCTAAEKVFTIFSIMDEP
jgi:nucleolar MIF4G domain-containing protein 1